MKKIQLIAAIVSIFMATSAAFAISLDSAKAKGLVGETPSGYLASSGAADAETQQLIQQVNSERRQKYQEIARKNGTSLSAVEALAAQKAIEATAPGNLVQLSDGTWKKK